MSDIPLDALEKLAEAAPHIEWDAYDEERLMTLIACPDLIDLPDAA